MNSKSPNFRQLPLKTAQKILQLVDKACKSFFTALADQKLNLQKYFQQLRILKYKPKGGQFQLVFNLITIATYALLHDFFHTIKHKSKIYIEPQLEDNFLVEKLRKHHEQTENPLIKTFQFYDRLAARITQKIRHPITSRYKWQVKRLIEKIDFKKLAQEIKEVTKTNIWNLHTYIYKSREFILLNESMNHGNCILRDHLLVIANLIVQDLNFKNRGNLHKKRLMAVPTLNEAIRG